MVDKKAVKLGITPDENLELRAEDMTYEDEQKPPASASPRKRVKKAADNVLMDFPDAMRAIIDGKTVSKKEWDDTTYQCRLNGDELCILKPDGKWHPWLVSLGDMLGEDWFVV